MPKGNSPEPDLVNLNRGSDRRHRDGGLHSGAEISGPAVIVEDETSTVVSRLFDARIDDFGYIELTRR
jgi:N-methylhydantoinase A